MRKGLISLTILLAILLSACGAEGERPEIRDMAAEPYLCDLFDFTIPEGFDLTYGTEYADEDQVPLSEVSLDCDHTNIILQLKGEHAAEAEIETYRSDIGTAKEQRFCIAGMDLVLYMQRDDGSELDDADRKAFDDFYASIRAKEPGLSEEHEEINGISDIEVPEEYFLTTITWGRNDDGSLWAVKEWINDKDAILQLRYQNILEDKNSGNGDETLSQTFSMDGKDYQLYMYPVHPAGSGPQELSAKNHEVFEALCGRIVR